MNFGDLWEMVLLVSEKNCNFVGYNKSGKFALI